MTPSRRLFVVARLLEYSSCLRCIDLRSARMPPYKVAHTMSVCTSGSWSSSGRYSMGVLGCVDVTQEYYTRPHYANEY